MDGLVISPGFVLAEEVRGLAIGLVNYSGQLRGVQLGLFNYAANNPRGLRLLPLVNVHL